MPAKRVSPKIRLVLWIILTTVLSSVISLLAQAPDSCAPMPAVKAALDDLPSYPTPDQTRPQFREQRMARIQALPGQYPGDVFIERTYIDFQSWTPERDQLGDNQKAQQELAKIDQRFEELKSLAGTKEDRMKECSSRQVAYWELMARLAEAENNKLDSMRVLRKRLADAAPSRHQTRAGRKR